MLLQGAKSTITMIGHCRLIFKFADAIEVPFESLKLMGALFVVVVCPAKSEVTSELICMRFKTDEPCNNR
jgi:hypothetical protein